MDLQDYTRGLYKEIRKACDLSLYWGHSDFHCLRQFSPDIRMWFAMNAVEAEISNGGLPQLLWNCLAHWRELLVDALYGYDKIGASQYSGAVVKIICLFNWLEQELVQEESRVAFTRMIQEGLHPLGQWGQSIKEKIPEEVEDMFFQVEKIDPLKVALLDLTYDGILNEIRSQS